MLATLVLAGLLSTSAGTATSAQPAAGTTDADRCRDTASTAKLLPGTPLSADPNSLSAADAAALQRDFRQRLRTMPAQARVAHVVKVYFHVIEGVKNHGAVPNRQIRRQIDVLNDSFAGRTGRKSHGTAFRFELAGIDRTKNPDWFTAGSGSQEQRDMKRTLRRGDASALNIYTNTPRDNSGEFILLGYANLPNNYRDHPKLDGVVLLWASLPGGPFFPAFNNGDTATHEVGHWLGLLHTFSNGCTRRNDWVTDTPQEAHPAFFCGHSHDSCKATGKDSIHNFMNYGSDKCINRFTRGQALRMRLMWAAYRR
jgi:hypothetical protein